MSSVPYSSFRMPALGQINDVSIDINTLADGDVVKYSTVSNTWVNGVNGGGVGISINGIDDAAVFKDGVNGNTFTGGITRNPASAGNALTLNTTAFRCGIGGLGNALNPVNTLEVAGGVRVTNGADQIVIDSNSIGNIVAGTTLRLYSNTSLAAEDITEVDSVNKALIVGGTLQTLDPLAFDAPNGSITDGLFKLKLQLGYNKAVAPVGSFDVQENLSNALGFPTGQTLQYINNLPLYNRRIIGRIASGVSVVPGANYVLSSLGTTTAFQDRMLYDPCNMRTRKIVNTWLYFGAPNELRVATSKLAMTIKVFFHGTWLGVPDTANNAIIYLHQYRNGILLRSLHLCSNRSLDGECMMGAERTMLGYSASFGEDFDPITDDYNVDIINQSPFGANDVRVDTAQVELSFELVA